MAVTTSVVREQKLAHATALPAEPLLRDHPHRPAAHLRLGDRRHRGVGETLGLTGNTLAQIGVVAATGSLVAAAGPILLLALVLAGPFLFVAIVAMLAASFALVALVAMGAAG
jgi:hypothetical protein